MTPPDTPPFPASPELRPPEGRDGPRLVAIVIAGLGVAATTIALLRLDLVRVPFVEPLDAAVRANTLGLGLLAAAVAFTWLGLSVLWWRLARDPDDWHGRHRRLATLVIIAVALTARIAVTAGHAPQLSEDVYRYAFDGRNQEHGLNPYVVVPKHRIAATEPRWTGEARIAAEINNPELSTIYLPTSQWFFAGAARLTPPGDEPVAQTLGLRFALLGVEAILIGLLLLEARRRVVSPWWVALYAWHPLPITEIAGSGHQDVIGVLLLVVALTMAWRFVPTLGAVALAAGGLVKPMAIPIMAILLRRRSLLDWIIALVCGAVTTLLIAAPFFMNGDGALTGLLETAQRFALKWAHFGPIYEPLLSTVEHFTPEWTNDPQERLARGLCAAVLAVIGLVTWWRCRDAWRSASTIFLAMVLLSPTAHPWYLLWALALVPFARSLTVWVLSLTISLGYVALVDPLEWAVAPGVMILAFAPVTIALVTEYIVLPKRPGARRGNA